MNQSIIEHKANMYYVHLREDYLLLCMSSTYRKKNLKGEHGKASPYCKALILAILEHWINTKRDQGHRLEVSMTHQQWNHAMYGLFGRNVIIDSLDELVGEGLIWRETFKTTRGGKDQYRYFLNYQEVNARMRALPDRSPFQREPATFTYQPSSQQHLQGNGQGLQVNATRATSKSSTFTHQPCASVTTSQSKPFIDSRDSIHTQNRDSTQITGDVATVPVAQTPLPLSDTLQSSQGDEITSSRKPKTPRARKTEFAELSIPDLDGPTTKGTITALANFYRGGVVSKRKRDDANKAIDTLLNKPRQQGTGYTLREIDSVYRFLKKMPPQEKPWLIDENWGYPVDIWVIATNIETKLPVIAALEKKHVPRPRSTTQDEQESYVLWTRNTGNPAFQQFLSTPRGKQWYELAAYLQWEGMAVAEAKQYGWRLAYSMTDHETRMIAYAQQRRQEQTQVVNV